MSTRVGYAGGTTPDPTYRRIGDHTECIQVDFDPGVVSYEDLLAEFFTLHDASRPTHSSQYASLVLYSDEAQHSVASLAASEFAPRFGRPVLTRIEPLQAFFPAEDYHQKYALRADGLLDREVHERYPSESDFRDSMLAARLNGYAYGAGNVSILEREIATYGLSGAASAHLHSLVR